MDLTKIQYDTLTRDLKKSSCHITLKNDYYKIRDGNLYLELLSKNKDTNFKVESCTDYLWKESKEESKEELLVLIPTKGIVEYCFINFIRVVSNAGLTFCYFGDSSNLFFNCTNSFTYSGMIKKDSSGMFYVFNVRYDHIWAFIVTFRMYYLNTRLSNYLFCEKNNTSNYMLSILHLISNRNRLKVAAYDCIFFESTLFYEVANYINYRTSLGVLCSVIRDDSTSELLYDLIIKSKSKAKFNKMLSIIYDFYDRILIDKSNLARKEIKSLKLKFKVK